MLLCLLPYPVVFFRPVVDQEISQFLNRLPMFTVSIAVINHLGGYQYVAVGIELQLVTSPVSILDRGTVPVSPEGQRLLSNGRLPIQRQHGHNRFGDTVHGRAYEAQKTAFFHSIATGPGQGAHDHSGVP